MSSAVATATEPVPQPADRDRRPPRLGRHPLVVAGVLYLAGSVALHHEVAGDLTGSTTGWTSSDSHLFVWWLNWLPWSLQNGYNPLFSSFQHFPFGVNALWNTTSPVLAAVLTPVTVLIGPVAAYNVGMILGPVVSGLAMAWALGWYVDRWFPRVLAGALYGFNPFLLAHGSVGHLNLVWALLPPVLLWAVQAIFVRPGRHPWRVGALLGLAFAVQTGVYTQTVALGALVLLVAAVVLAARWPHRVAERLPFVGAAAVACIGVYVALCAYPLYLLLAGPARPRGQIRDPAQTGADVANLVVPTHLTALQFRLAELAGQLRSHSGEQGGYIGLLMLALLVSAAWVVPVVTVRILAAVGVVLVLLSFGTDAVVLGRDIGVPLPWRLVEHVPLVSQAEAVRLQVFIAACVAGVVALWLDHVLSWRSTVPRAAGIAAALLAALTWIPADVQRSVPATSPAFFLAAERHLVAEAVVETFPRVSGRWVGGARPLLWQVRSGMAYRTTGGYFIASDPDDDVVLEGPVNRYQVGAAQAGDGDPPKPPPEQAADELRALGVSAVVVVDLPEYDAAAVAAWTSEVTGSPGERIEDAWVFRFANA